MRRLEALADALARYSGWFDPTSEAYQNRNPGNLPAISPKHPRTASGKRIFDSALDGYQALLFDLEIKCSGRSNSHLKGDSTLHDLVLVRKEPATSALYLSRYLRRALQDETISEKTPLAYFLE